MIQNCFSKADKILNVEEMIQRAGSFNYYQLKMLISFFLVYLFSSFIQMGFPILFQPAKFVCQPGQDCSEAAVCSRETHTLSPDIKSIAYSFDLVCQRKRYLRTCFEAFLYGGFIGSLYYGEVIQRKGRRYAVIQSMIMMIGGLALSVISGSAVLFAFGVFFFNAGFRGFYNASLLSVSEVTNQVTRTATPMVFSIGWALGQIIIGIICLIIINWKIIFFLTVLPLGGLFYVIYHHIEDSPRFCVTKHEFGTAKSIIEKIGYINKKNMQGFALKQQLEYNQKMKNYQSVVQGGTFRTGQTHHSYMSLFRFKSIKIRVFIVGLIWSLISLSYFISANNQLNSNRSYSFNVILAGFIQIIAYLASIISSLNLGRIFVIRRLLVFSSIVHLLYYFIQPHDQYTGFSKTIILFLDIIVRLLMSYGNTFLAIYSIQLFPTVVRHFALGMLGFITKLTYMLSFIFSNFFTQRFINPNFILGLLFVGSIYLTPKLRQTREQGFKDNLQEDGDNTLMNRNQASIF